jgi:magnesium-transporting ATPase (P-type)
MSTIVDIEKTGKDHYKSRKVVCKGAPEVIQTLLKEVHPKYSEIFKEYSSKGYRVLALAYKEID